LNNLRGMEENHLLSVVRRLKACSDYRPKSLELFLQDLLDKDKPTD
jgi:hypothetical protein